MMYLKKKILIPALAIFLLADIDDPIHADSGEQSIRLEINTPPPIFVIFPAFIIVAGVVIYRDLKGNEKKHAVEEIRGPSVQDSSSIQGTKKDSLSGNCPARHRYGGLGFDGGCE
jgi:hypothetical protein